MDRASSRGPTSGLHYRDESIRKRGERRRGEPRGEAQLRLPFKRRGGRRPGAGRPPNGKRAGVPHLRRDKLSRHHPVHVTLRVVEGVPGLRRKKYGHTIFEALHDVRDDLGMQVTHFSIQPDHFHLIVEARDRSALSRGMQGLSIRLARRLNARMGRKGRFFADRYHARQLKTPLEVRRALAYVLNNMRRHMAQSGAQPPRDWADPYSSVDQFDGFRRLPSGRQPCAEFSLGRDSPVRSAKTWLLRKGWRSRGLLVLHDVPGGRARR